MAVRALHKHLPTPGQEFDIVAVAASAGGLQVLTELTRRLPADFTAAVLLAQHRAAAYPDLLEQLLTLRAALPVVGDADRQTPQSGRIYVAPAGRHLVVRSNGQLDTGREEPIRNVRPSADLLFESVAARYGSRAVAVVLTGKGDDGARGVREVRRCGGFVIAQDEATAEHFDMPRAAIDTGQVDLVLPAGRLAFALTALVMGAEAAVARHPDPGPIGRLARTG